MELGIDYNFRDDLWIESKKESTVPIEILIDPFKGVVYNYTTVSFKVGEDDVPRIGYDYEIIKTNDLSMMTLRKNEKFNRMLGLILNAMLLEMADAEDDIANRTNYPEKPDQE